MKSLFLAAAFFCMSVIPGLAWSDGGHKVVALIAYSQLDDATRAKFVEVLEHHPLWQEDFESEMPAQIVAGSETERQRWIFAQAAIWPDIARKYRTPPNDYHRGTWHYINAPIFISPEVEAAAAGHLPLNLSFEWTPSADEDLQNGPQTIEMAKSIIRDPAVTPERKAVMLCWLLHVAGDLHQPMHCAALVSKRVFRQGDRGGNGIELKRQRDRRGKTLHSFWDGLHGSNVSLNEANSTMASILGEEGIKQKAEAAAQNLTVKDWVTEGKKIAEKSAYNEQILNAVRAADQQNNHNNESKVTVIMTDDELRDYGKAAGPIATERAAIGGYRLGAILRDLLK